MSDELSAHPSTRKNQAAIAAVAAQGDARDVRIHELEKKLQEQERLLETATSMLEIMREEAKQRSAQTQNDVVVGLRQFAKEWADENYQKVGRWSVRAIYIFVTGFLLWLSAPYLVKYILSLNR